MGNSVGGDDRVLTLAEGDKGNIEGAAAEIVDGETVGATALAFSRVAVRELQRRSGRFVEEAENLKAARAGRLFGKEALVAVGVGGNAEHGFEGLIDGRFQVGMIAQMGVKRGHGLPEQHAQRDVLADYLDLSA